MVLIHFFFRFLGLCDKWMFCFDSFFIINFLVLLLMVAVQDGLELGSGLFAGYFAFLFCYGLVVLFSFGGPVHVCFPRKKIG